MYTKILFPGPQVQKLRRGGGGRSRLRLMLTWMAEGGVQGSLARIYVVSVRARGWGWGFGAGTGGRWMLVGK